jgi:hypothetical protein
MLFDDPLRQAEPKELLHSRYQQFQRRLARHLSKVSEFGQEPDNAPPRQPLQLREQNVTQTVRQITVQDPKPNNFLVYHEGEEERRTNAETIGGGVSGWTNLPSEKQRTKENTGDHDNFSLTLIAHRHCTKMD